MRSAEYGLTPLSQQQVAVNQFDEDPDGQLAKLQQESTLQKQRKFKAKSNDQDGITQLRP